MSKYDQCKYKDYDLFDRHSARGYTSIGLGEEQRPELAALTMPERMSLAVLKVPPPHSSPDRRAASTSSLATLLICASSPLVRLG